MTKKNNNYNRRKQHKNNNRISKIKTNSHRETKKIRKSIEFNRYEGSKGSVNFNYIKMPYINTSVVESKNLLVPLKYIGTNKDSINTEVSVSNVLDNIKKDEKQNHLNPKKDFYTYVNYAWMKEQDIRLNYEKYYFVKLDSFRFVQNTVNHRIIQLARDYCKNNKNATAKKVGNIMYSMDHENLSFNHIKKYIDIMENEYKKYVSADDLTGYLSNINR